MSYAKKARAKARRAKLDQDDPERVAIRNLIRNGKANRYTLLPNAETKEKTSVVSVLRNVAGVETFEKRIGTKIVKKHKLVGTAGVIFEARSLSANRS